MTKKEALVKSIHKWAKIVHSGGEDRAWNNCVLCHLYIWNHCLGCPVCEDGGTHGCGHTPYADWVDYTFGNGDKVFDEISHDLAVKELMYLQGLLTKLNYNLKENPWK